MATKIKAARICVNCDCNCVIMSSLSVEKVPERLSGEDHGTLFVRSEKHLVSNKKRWLLSCQPSGKIIVDLGARRALRKRNSLFAAGIKQVTGSFQSQDVVVLEDTNGSSFGKGVTN